MSRAVSRSATVIAGAGVVERCFGATDRTWISPRTGGVAVTLWSDPYPNTPAISRLVRPPPGRSFLLEASADHGTAGECRHECGDARRGAVCMSRANVMSYWTRRAGAALAQPDRRDPPGGYRTGQPLPKRRHGHRMAAAFPPPERAATRASGRQRGRRTRRTWTAACPCRVGAIQKNQAELLRGFIPVAASQEAGFWPHSASLHRPVPRIFESRGHRVRRSKPPGTLPRQDVGHR